MEKCFVGIDGGATKTALIAARGDGTVVAQTETMGSSWREHGALDVAAILFDAVTNMGLERGQIGGIAAGLPCYGESVDGDAVLRKELNKVFPGIPIYLTNDVEVGWAGALAMKPGIHLVAGTGSIAYGVDGRGDTARCGGWDEFYSDEGSAHWIARRGMELFSKQSDGRVAKGAMLDVVRGEFSLDSDMAFIDHIHKHFAKSRKDRAAFQLLVAKAARMGDPAAIEIYKDAALELHMMAGSIRRQLEMPAEGWRVSYSGGVFKTGDLILGPLRELVEADGGILQEPKFPPVKGALLMAIDMFGG